MPFRTSVKRLVWLIPVSAALVVGLTRPGQTQSIADIVERSRPSLAFVLATSERDRSSGSAFVINGEGLLVTALHIAEAARELSVTFPGGPTVPASVVAADAEADLAILRVARTGLRALPLATPQAMRQGDEVLVLGYPLASVLGNYDVTVTRGIVSALRPELGMIQVDAAMNPGVSGGPVLNSQGEVIGVAVAGLRARQQVNFAVPVGSVAKLVDQIAGRPIPELPALRIPLLVSQEVPLAVQKGFPASSTGTELGAPCTTPSHRLGWTRRGSFPESLHRPGSRLGGWRTHRNLCASTSTIKPVS